ncbi:helix-turn-helix domain-containing protein [Psychrobacter halodurans]|uniref:Helix-turn-helix transcriptional regulator n=1 Tax=Psychrobacter halodurans TaxID=2818439 RepID=A0AAW4ISZ5_9GAMM|nr:helix-turn-helix transcriptional regulator [Psychrobacter halodurans]MBO1516781.1 helix-turn-helix transcriptional regulator [Psychrobacter halodurans]
MRKEAILSQFGTKVKLFRNERDISQEKLAELSKLDRTYISSIERGQRNIGILNIIKIADALQVKASSLLEEIGDFDA